MFMTHILKFPMDRRNPDSGKCPNKLLAHSSDSSSDCVFVRCLLTQPLPVPKRGLAWKRLGKKGLKTIGGWGLSGPWASLFKPLLCVKGGAKAREEIAKVVWSSGLPQGLRLDASRQTSTSKAILAKSSCRSSQPLLCILDIFFEKPYGMRLGLVCIFPNVIPSVS